MSLLLGYKLSRAEPPPGTRRYGRRPPLEKGLLSFSSFRSGTDSMALLVLFLLFFLFERPIQTRSSAVAVIADRTAYRAYGAPYE